MIDSHFKTILINNLDGLPEGFPEAFLAVYLNDMERLKNTIGLMNDINEKAPRLSYHEKDKCLMASIVGISLLETAVLEQQFGMACFLLKQGCTPTKSVNNLLIDYVTDNHDIVLSPLASQNSSVLELLIEIELLKRLDAKKTNPVGRGLNTPLLFFVDDFGFLGDTLETEIKKKNLRRKELLQWIDDEIIFLERDNIFSQVEETLNTKKQTRKKEM